MTKKRSDLNSPKQNYTHFPHTYLLNEVINSTDYSTELFLANFFSVKKSGKDHLRKMCDILRKIPQYKTSNFEMMQSNSIPHWYMSSFQSKLTVLPYFHLYRDFTFIISIIVTSLWNRVSHTFMNTIQTSSESQVTCQPSLNKCWSPNFNPGLKVWWSFAILKSGNSSQGRKKLKEWENLDNQSLYKWIKQKEYKM